MKDQLTRYVDLLFAGAPDAEDIKQEILQNTLDRYDDLISQGKAPQAAYSLAISGIGDINEILSSQPAAEVIQTAAPKVQPMWKKVLRAVAIFLYILCPVPMFALDAVGMDELGLCGLLAMVAIATALLIISGEKSEEAEEKESEPDEDAPRSEVHKAIRGVITAIGLVTKELQTALALCNLESIPGMNTNTGAVVAAILQLRQPVEQDGSCRICSRVSHDSAHDLGSFFD